MESLTTLQVIFILFFVIGASTVLASLLVTGAIHHKIYKNPIVNQKEGNLILIDGEVQEVKHLNIGGTSYVWSNDKKRFIKGEVNSSEGDLIADEINNRDSLIAVSENTYRYCDHVFKCKFDLCEYDSGTWSFDVFKGTQLIFSSEALYHDKLVASIRAMEYIDRQRLIEHIRTEKV